MSDLAIILFLPWMLCGALTFCHFVRAYRDFCSAERLAVSSMVFPAAIVTGPVAWMLRLFIRRSRA